jgi:hypothetical protein
MIFRKPRKAGDLQALRGKRRMKDEFPLNFFKFNPFEATKMLLKRNFGCIVLLWYWPHTIRLVLVSQKHFPEEYTMQISSISFRSVVVLGAALAILGLSQAMALPANPTHLVAPTVSSGTALTDPVAPLPPFPPGTNGIALTDPVAPLPPFPPGTNGIALTDPVAPLPPFPPGTNGARA